MYAKYDYPYLNSSMTQTVDVSTRYRCVVVSALLQYKDVVTRTPDDQSHKQHLHPGLGEHNRPYRSIYKAQWGTSQTSQEPIWWDCTGPNITKNGYAEIVGVYTFDL
jgi:hypothetical protein